MIRKCRYPPTFTILETGLSWLFGTQLTLCDNLPHRKNMNANSIFVGLIIQIDKFDCPSGLYYFVPIYWFGILKKNSLNDLVCPLGTLYQILIFSDFEGFLGFQRFDFSTFRFFDFQLFDYLLSIFRFSDFSIIRIFNFSIITIITIFFDLSTFWTYFIKLISPYYVAR